MFTLTKIFPQIGWAVPTASLAYLPLLTTDDEFHTWGALPQVQMGKGWAGNRYHKQRAMLSVPFRLTYFSTRNSSTQVSASNPVLLFHCSCHRAPDRRRKRGEHGTGGRCTRFTWALPFLLSHHITELLNAQSRALWELSLWRTACVNNFPIMMAYPVNCSNWSEHLKCLQKYQRCPAFSSLMESCACVSVFICGIYIHADVKNWVSVQNLMRKILLPKCFIALVGDYGKAGDFRQAWKKQNNI